MTLNRNENLALAKTGGSNFKLVRSFPKTRILLPALSKSNLHNYFADKMAVFSVLIGFVSEKSGNTAFANSFGRLYKKLIRMRASFLIKYHKLSRKAGHGATEKTERVKVVFDHIYQFEKNVVSEIVKAGLQPQEIMEFNRQKLLSK